MRRTFRVLDKYMYGTYMSCWNRRNLSAGKIFIQIHQLDFCFSKKVDELLFANSGQNNKCNDTFLNLHLFRFKKNTQLYHSQNLFSTPRTYTCIYVPNIQLQATQLPIDSSVGTDLFLSVKILSPQQQSSFLHSDYWLRRFQWNVASHNRIIRMSS